MFSSIVGKFKEITQISNQGDENLTVSDYHGNDSDEDGFMILGKTQSERMAVVGHQFNSASIDAPPTYDQLMASPPFHTSCQGMPSPEPTVNNMSPNATPITAVSDIPFKLSAGLSILKDLRENPLYTFLADTQNTDFNWSAYYYDFQYEEAFLQEYRNSDSSSKTFSY